MPHELFGDVVVRPAKLRSCRSSILIGSIAAHVIGGTSLLIASLSAIVTLPTPQTRLSFEHVRPVAIDIELPAPPRTARATTTTTTPTPMVPVTVPSESAPLIAPTTISPETGREGLPFAGATTSIAAIDAGSVGDLLGAPEPLTPTAPPPPEKPLRLHSGIQAPQKTMHVAPDYPRIARESRVQGTVIVEAIIDVSGRVEGAQVLRSIPLLDQSALDAVRQWRFTPARLNDRAVPVVMTVTVTFTLER